MYILLVLCTNAMAQEPAWYDPDRVAQHSTLFDQAAGALAPAFEEAQSTLAAQGEAASHLQRSATLLGDRATEELVTWAETANRTLMGQYVQVQRHVDLLQDDFAQVFTRAVQRGLPQLSQGRAVQECKSSGVQALMGRASCPGTDVSKELAAVLDADTELEAEVGEINRIPWPDVGIEVQVQQPVALYGTTPWMQVHRVAEALAGDALERLDATLEDQLWPLDEALSMGDPTALEEAKRLRAAYDAQLAALGSALWEAMMPALERSAKKGGPQEVGLCGNPKDLGGCPGEDVTDQLLPVLLADRRLIRASQKW